MNRLRLIEAPREVASGAVLAESLRRLMPLAVQKAESLGARAKLVRAVYQRGGSEDDLHRSSQAEATYFAFMAALGASMSTGLAAALAASECAATRGGRPSGKSC